MSDTTTTSSSPLFQEQLYFLPLRTRDFEANALSLGGLLERTTWRVSLPLLLLHLLCAVVGVAGLLLAQRIPFLTSGMVLPSFLKALLPLVPAWLVLLLGMQRMYSKLRNYALPYQGKLGKQGRKTLIQSDLFFVLRLLLSLVGLAVGSYYWYRLVPLPLLTGFLVFVGIVAFLQYCLTFLPWEVILYLVFGGLTTVVSVLSFTLLDHYWNAGTALQDRWDWVVPKALSFVLAILFAYVTNRKYVFRSQAPVLPEFCSFLFARISASLILEGGGLYVLVNLLEVDKQIANLFVAILVVVVNYILSKLSVFRRTVHVDI